MSLRDSGVPPELARAISRALPEYSPAAFQLLSGGVCNRVYRVTLEGLCDAFVVRLYDRDPGACAKEVALHSLITARVPVPEIVHAEPEGDGETSPYMVMRWVDGVTYRELKRSGTAGEIAAAAACMGATLARIGSFSFAKPGRIGAGLEVGSPLVEGPDPTPRFIEQCLESPVLARRMDGPLRAHVRDFAWRWAPQLAALDSECRLVHSDFGSPNVILHRPEGCWQVAAVLDWEFAFSGAPLCDVAHALRYERWDAPRMEPYFSDAFCSEGGELPEDWRALGRAVDLTALCECLTRTAFPDELVGEIVELIAATLKERDRG